METVHDRHYDLLRRRSGSRAVAVMLASLAVGGSVFMAGFMAGPGFLGLSSASGLAPVSVIAPSPPGGCTRGDLAKPALTSMPLPEVVAAPVTVHPAPELERLSPPAGAPRVSAGRAWEAMRDRGFTNLTADGPVHVVLGDLFSAGPLVAGPHRAPRPLFDHVLVWAVYGVHQPEVPARPPGAGDPPCYFESTVFYVDAVTGRSLAAEVFVPSDGGGAAV